MHINIDARKEQSENTSPTNEVIASLPSETVDWDATTPDPTEEEYQLQEPDYDYDPFIDQIDEWRRKARALAEFAAATMVNHWDGRRPFRSIDARNKKWDQHREVDPSSNTLTEADLAEHFRGNDPGDTLWIDTIGPDNTCKWAAFLVGSDVDNDDRSVVGANYRNAISLFNKLVELGLHPVLTDRNGNGACVIYIFFAEPISSEAAFDFVERVRADMCDFELRALPNQPRFEPGASDNGLMLFGLHSVRQHLTEVFDGQYFREGQEAIDLLIEAELDDPALVIELAQTRGNSQAVDARDVSSDDAADETVADEFADPAPIDDDNPAAGEGDDQCSDDQQHLGSIDRIFIYDPLALQAVVQLWPAGEFVEGSSASGPSLDLGAEISPLTEVLLLAGHVILKRDGSFDRQGWNQTLRNAVKTVREFRRFCAESVSAADWLLASGIKAAGPDSEGFLPEDVLSIEQRAKTVKSFLCERYASKRSDYVGVGVIAEQAALFAAIDAITLQPVETTAGTEPDRSPFPTHLLPLEVAEFVRQTAASMPVDEAMVALPALACLGACIGTTRQISPKRGWTEFPILWTAVIAESGQHKTPTFSAVAEPLHEMQFALDRRYKIEKRNYDRRAREYARARADGAGDDQTRPPGDPPSYGHLFTTDCTVEGVTKILSTSPRGTMVLKDELSDWVGSFNSYKKAGSDHAKYLEFFNGKMVKIDRKTQEPICIPRAAVCIAGTIQPSVFWTAMSGHEQDGFLARFLLACPPPAPGGCSDDEVAPCVKERWAATLRRLYALQFELRPVPGHESATEAQPVVIGLSAEAQNTFKAFRISLSMRISQLKNPALAAAFRKMEGYALKFALIFHLVESTAEAVDAAILNRAIQLTEWFMAEARQIYSMRAEMSSAAAVEQGELFDYIRGKGGRVMVTVVRQNLRRYKKIPTQVLVEDLQVLVDLRLGRWLVPKKEFMLNPASNAPLAGTPDAGTATR